MLYHWMQGKRVREKCLTRTNEVAVADLEGSLWMLWKISRSVKQVNREVEGEKVRKRVK